MFEGHQESLDRRVAVKILPKDITFTREQVERFHREAEAAGRLNHPNIVAVYGITEAEGHHFIVQEYVGGGSLEDVLDGQKDQATDAGRCKAVAGLARQIADGLHHAHTKGVVHRDMKPGNILLTEAGTPKITDFGLARVDDKLGLSQTGAVMGTPHYMSPEQVNARPSAIDARTDVYGLGAMLYKMLTHRVPFEANTMQGIFLDILTRIPKSPRKHQPGIHPDLEAVCLKALEKAPEARYQSCGEFAADLDRYLKGQPTLARPVNVFGQAARSLQRMATSTLAVVALLVPTAWIAVDQLLLRPPAASSPDLHWLRLGLTVLATLVLAWPLSLVGVRLARAQGWGAIPAWALALLVGAAVSVRIVEERTTQIHEAARTVLREQVELEQVGDRRDIHDLQAYEAEWGPRFETDDLWLMARGYLKRLRATEAQGWALRMQATESNSAVYYAMLTVIHDALGQEDEARSTDDLLREHSRFLDDWREWRLIGDIMRDARRYDVALEAYGEAGQREGVDRDLINLKLAEANADLCAWDEAGRRLAAYIEWNERDPAANRLAFDLALRDGDDARAATHLERFEASDEVYVEGKLALREGYLRHLRRDDEAWAFIATAVEAPDADPNAIVWSASRFYQAGSDAARFYDAYHQAGHEEEAAGYLATATELLDEARRLYQRLDDRHGPSAEAAIGLCASHLAMVALTDDPAERARLLQTATEHAQRAVDIDPNYYQAHYNLGIARYRSSLAGHGASDAGQLPLDAVSAYVEAYERSLQLNGLQPALLNDTADGLKRIHALSRDRAALDRAFDYLRRAIAQRTPQADSRCGLGSAVRYELSAFHTTVRECHELAGNLPAALAAARLALDVLDPKDPTLAPLVPRRRDAVEKLAARVGGG